MGAEFVKVTAIVRADLLPVVEKRLHRMGMRGISISRLTDTGRRADRAGQDRAATDARMEGGATWAEAQEILGFIGEKADAIAAIVNELFPGHKAMREGMAIRAWPSACQSKADMTQAMEANGSLL